MKYIIFENFKSFLCETFGKKGHPGRFLIQQNLSTNQYEMKSFAKTVPAKWHRVNSPKSSNKKHFKMTIESIGCHRASM